EEMALAEYLKSILTKEKIKYDEESINLIAQCGDGSVRDTLSIADMCVAFTNGNLSEPQVLKVLGAVSKKELLELINNILTANVNGVVQTNNNIFSLGRNPISISRDLTNLLKNLVVLKNGGEKLVPLSSSIIEQCKKVLQNAQNLEEVFESAVELEMQLKQSANAKNLFETWCVKASLKKNDNLSNIDLNKPETVSNNVLKDCQIDMGRVLSALRQSGNNAIIGALNNADVKVENNTLNITVLNLAEKTILENGTLNKFLPTGSIVKVALVEKKDYSSSINKLREKFGEKLVVKKES
ncbi:MAG: hypothetical protein FWD32_00700, partial [Firmicutes bacterium]|nr:hypothetical protein [Bacillota bacterium]